MLAQWAEAGSHELRRADGGVNSDAIEADWDAVGALRDPVFVVALRGAFDTAGAATSALDWMLDERPVTIVATIDPDPFFDFTQERPETYLDEDDERRIRWADNEVLVARFPDGARDLVVLAGVEPHLRMRSFVDLLVGVAHRLACRTVVTVGATPEAVPHTRVPTVVGSTTDATLATRLHLSRPTYEGVTGVAGVLLERLDHARIPAVSLRVGVPAYLLHGGAQHPKSSAALLRHLERVLGVPTRHAELSEEIQRWAELHDTAVEGDEETAEFVRALEVDHDRCAEQDIPTAEELGRQLEEFLREFPPPDDPGEA
jgi:proteasome assembly chaperone (PAC2) family protein